MKPLTDHQLRALVVLAGMPNAWVEWSKWRRLALSDGGRPFLWRSMMGLEARGLIEANMFNGNVSFFRATLHGIALAHQVGRVTP